MEINKVSRVEALKPARARAFQLFANGENSFAEVSKTLQAEFPGLSLTTKNVYEWRAMYDRLLPAEEVRKMSPPKRRDYVRQHARPIVELAARLKNRHAAALETGVSEFGVDLAYIVMGHPEKACPSVVKMVLGRLLEKVSAKGAGLAVLDKDWLEINHPQKLNDAIRLSIRLYRDSLVKYLTNPSAFGADKYIPVATNDPERLEALSESQESLTPAERQAEQIVRLYRDGNSIEAVTEIAQCGKERVMDCLLIAGIPPRDDREPTWEQIVGNLPESRLGRILLDGMMGRMSELSKEISNAKAGWDHQRSRVIKLEQDLLAAQEDKRKALAKQEELVKELADVRAAHPAERKLAIDPVTKLPIYVNTK